MVKQNDVDVDVCKRSSGWIRYDNHIHITQPTANYVPNCLMKFAVGERNVAIRYIYLPLVVLYEYDYRRMM